MSNLQSWNRYSYVLNNPLSFTDPSGFFFSSIFKAIGNFFSSIFQAIGPVFKAILNVPILREAIQIVACAASTIACGITSGLIALASGGSIVDALKAMAISFANIGVWTGVGGFITGPLQGLIGAGPLFALAKGVIHGVIGGAMSLAQGGSFLEGFAANAIGAATGVFSDIVSNGNILLDTMIVATAGGVSAELTGGKFGNGALTAAFANLYNKFGAQDTEEDDPYSSETIDAWREDRTPFNPLDDCLHLLASAGGVQVACGGGGGGAAGRTGAGKPTAGTVRGLWTITKEGTARVMRHDNFGKFYKSKSDGLWWSKDMSGHGGSRWKVYEETSTGLKWRADANEFGGFIAGKYKGPIGTFIPWKQLNSVPFE